MMPPWRDLFIALAAYADAPHSDEARRNLAVAGMRCAGENADETRWPGICTLAMLCAHEVMNVRVDGPRAEALGRAAAVIVEVGRGDVGDIHLPTGEAFAPRQYKDEG